MKNKIGVLENDIYLFPIVNSVNNLLVYIFYTVYTIALLTSSLYIETVCRERGEIVRQLATIAG